MSDTYEKLKKQKDEILQKEMTTRDKQLELALKALEEIANSVLCDWEAYADIATTALSSINSLSGGNETP